jgi:hypothetical protein
LSPPLQRGWPSDRSPWSETVQAGAPVVAQVPVLASFDISSSHQVPDFPAAKARDASFAFVKDTAGIGYVNSTGAADHPIQRGWMQHQVLQPIGPARSGFVELELVCRPISAP